MIDEIKKTIALEGGATITHDPNDPGGTTRYGISQKAFPNEDIETLTEDRAIQLAQERYWNPLHLDNYQYKPFRWKVFDIAFLQGPAKAQDYLLQLGSIDSDEAVWQLCEMMMKKFVEIVIAKPSQLVYLRGWTRRAFDRGEGL